MFDFEDKYIKLGAKYISGTDEAGRGPLAGPVCVASVVMPLDKESIIEGVNDSKKLSEKKRNELYVQILEKALAVSAVMIDEKVIDNINILNATKQGMVQSINELSVKPDVALIDAVKLDINTKTESIVQGDARSYSIACASIVAKVTRDLEMQKLHIIYPQYGFDKHKGYGTKLHIENIKKHGLCDSHRRSFVGKIVSGGA